MAKDQAQSRLKILIAEDEQNIGDLLFELLEQEDREIVLVSNGKEAIEELERQRYDLLITDLMMPEVDGIQVLHQAKKLHPNIMVIIITGYASLETAIQAVKEGAYDYLRKPFRLEELKISVDNACEKLRLQRENERLLEYVRTLCSVDQDGVSQDTKGDGATDARAMFGPEWFSPFMLEQGKGSSFREEVIGQIERLGRLKSQGIITNDEFLTLKRKLFDEI